MADVTEVKTEKPVYNKRRNDSNGGSGGGGSSSSGGGGSARSKRANVDPGRSTPMLDMFRTFRGKLDSINDQRERIVKCSRDITAESKKVIFTLQRSTGDAEQSKVLFEEARAKLAEINVKLRTVAVDLKDADFHRYNRQITPGLQEFVEAISFLYYLEHNGLIPLEYVRSQYLTWEDVPSLPISEEDFLLGLSDLTGELMRHSINAVAAGNTERAFDVLGFMRAITSEYRNVPNHQVFGIRKKFEVMEQSLAKVEKACYAVTVRGSEYPKEMLVKMLQGDGGGVQDDDGGDD